MAKRTTPEPRLILDPHEAERIREDLVDYTTRRCARAAGVSEALLIRAAARLPLRERDAQRIRAVLDTFTPLPVRP